MKMKGKTILIGGWLLILAILTLSGRQEPRYASYGNPRFGFSIEYPADFVMQPPPQNDDGRTFLSPDRSATLRVWGSFNVLGEETSVLYQGELARIKVPVAYKVLKGNWFVISWLEGEMIHYLKTFVGSNVITAFLFSYPKARSSDYQAVTQHLEKTFKPGNIDVF